MGGCRLQALNVQARPVFRVGSLDPVNIAGRTVARIPDSVIYLVFDYFCVPCDNNSMACTECPVYFHCMP